MSPAQVSRSAFSLVWCEQGLPRIKLRKSGNFLVLPVTFVPDQYASRSPDPQHFRHSPVCDSQNHRPGGAISNLPSARSFPGQLFPNRPFAHVFGLLLPFMLVAAQWGLSCAAEIAHGPKWFRDCGLPIRVPISCVLRDFFPTPLLIRLAVRSHLPISFSRLHLTRRSDLLFSGQKKSHLQGH